MVVPFDVVVAVMIGTVVGNLINFVFIKYLL